MTRVTVSNRRKLSRRRVSEEPAARGALARFDLGQPGPFISNAEAATPTLRLLMWQPYAIKETIAAFETKFKREVRADILRRQLGSLQQAEGRRHQGFRHGHGGRLLAAPLFPPGPDQGGRLFEDPEHQRGVSRFPARQVQAARGRRRQEQWSRRPIAGAAMASPSTPIEIAKEDIGSIELLLNEQICRPFLHQFAVRRKHRADGHPGGIQARHQGRASGPDGKPFNPYQLTDDELAETKRL